MDTSFQEAANLAPNSVLLPTTDMPALPLSNTLPAKTETTGEEDEGDVSPRDLQNLLQHLEEMAAEIKPEPNVQQQQQQQQLQLQQQQQQMMLQQQQQLAMLLPLQQVQQHQQPQPQQQQNVPPVFATMSTSEPPPLELLSPPYIPPPEMHQIVYAVSPPLYVYPSMFSFYPMVPETPYSPNVVNSQHPASYQSTLPMKIKKVPANKDSTKKKQVRKTLWIPLSVENVFLNWFEKIGSTQYRCKRDACVGLIEAIADSGDIEEWVPEAQKIFNEDSKRKGRDLIWDKLNDLGKTFCDEKRTWSLTFSAAVLKYCRTQEMDAMY